MSDLWEVRVPPLISNMLGVIDIHEIDFCTHSPLSWILLSSLQSFNFKLSQAQLAVTVPRESQHGQENEAKD
jgi:hypothetical protein